MSGQASALPLGNLESLGPFLPELLLCSGIVVLLLWDLVGRGTRRFAGLVIVLAFLTAAAAATVATASPVARGLFGGLLARDPFADFFKLFFAAATALVAVMSLRSRDAIEHGGRDAEAGEYFALLLTLALGMFLMAAAADLLLAYLSLEMVSLVSYVLAGFRRRDRASSEAALKYVIYGGVASGAMLYGMSFLYGLAGATGFAAVHAALGQAGTPVSVLLVAVVLCLAGFGYKLASVPFHMWCPDVYQGAPTPVTAFLSVGPKAAGFALLIRFLWQAIPGSVAQGGIVAALPWPELIGCISVATMTLGNLVAIWQQNLKRLLAYSSIAHAGYLLLGFAVFSATGQRAILFYLVVYLLMNLGAFLVVIALFEAGVGERVDDYQGLGSRAPFVAVVMAIFLVSLTGLPPMAGFVGKLLIFMALLEKGGNFFVALAVIGVLNSAISLYYYARVLKAMFLDRPAEGTAAAALAVPALHRAMLGALAIPTVLLGIAFSPLLAAVDRSLTLWSPQLAAKIASGMELAWSLFP